ncbi:MAG: FtsW/RodA/SpoVE family cell cycle protein, partial [Eubacteriales bacterium]
IVCLLVFAENHVSGTIIIALIGLSTIWAGGGKKVWYVIFIIAVVVAIVLLVQFNDQITQFLPDYAQKRIDMWLNPENYDTQDDTWQTVQGEIAVGSGGLFGRGFGKSLQKHLFVSQPQNDFIFSIVCEELGFVGALCIIALYLAFVWRGLTIARRTPDPFASVTAVGIVSHVGIQAFLNMMVVTALIPNTGITLPFFSYGGSSLVILMVEMGVLLSISRYSRISK